MEKPVVFLSHSSEDKTQLIKLKKLLEHQASGFIKFFLSSDGESIPLGTSWHERIVKALKDAKLMFVFVSKESVKSGWVYFEAGYAFSKNIRVVPMCLPGVSMNRLPAPLNLLQAHELHSSKALNKIVQVCNEVFQTKVPESFSKNDYLEVFGEPARKEGVSLFPPWEEFIDRIEIRTEANPGSAKIFATICRNKKLDCSARGLDRNGAGDVLSTGVTLLTRERNAQEYLYESEVGRESNLLRCFFTLSPQLFNMTSGLLDDWREKANVSEPLEIEMFFTPSVCLERAQHRLTTKIYGSDIALNPDGKLRLWNLRFSLYEADPDHYLRKQYEDVPDPLPVRLCMTHTGKLVDLFLRDLVLKLFEKDVLWMEKGAGRQRSSHR